MEHWRHHLHNVSYTGYKCRLCGFPPFYDENNQQLFNMIQSGQFDFPSPYWDGISDSAKNLIKSLLIVDHKMRLDADAILAHPWISGGGTADKNLPEVTAKLKEFNARRKLKRAGNMVLAANRFKNSI